MHFRSCDLSVTADIAGFVKGLRREFGAFYGLVNNAGIGTGGLLANMPDAQIERLVRLNTMAPIVLTKYVVRSMMADGAGRIVNVSSIVSFTGYSGLSVYSATKASLVGFTRSLAREVGKVGITVNAVAPGFVDTEMTEGLEGEQRAKIMRTERARAAGVRSRTSRNAVEFLLSDKAAKHHRHSADRRRRQHRLSRRATHVKHARDRPECARRAHCPERHEAPRAERSLK